MAYEKIREDVENNIKIRSKGLSLNKHFSENEKLAWHPYILHNRLASLLNNYIGYSCKAST